MKIELRQHVAVDGAMRRHVEAERVDWDKRIVWLDEERWIPFENIAAGGRDPAPSPYPPTPELAKAAPREAHACACGKVYGNPQGLGAHQRFCKGVAT